MVLMSPIRDAFVAARAFPTRIRYGALAIGFDVSVSRFGGTTPLVTAWLVDAAGNPMMPAYYLMASSVIGVVSVLGLRETAREPLLGSGPRVATKAEAVALALRKLKVVEAGKREREVVAQRKRA
ncbi:general substrate transporter [Caballeronia fortuita]|uniref:General substrate transporter n=1 Tax=Caballeronia fortuita TaxID=1777138 RepID=A0A158C8K9_9BURK|nr:general substrate transporter [Caballeronia fortuita]